MPAPQVARASCPEPSFAKPCAKSAVLGVTPNLDRLAAQGMNIRQCVANTTTTSNACATK